jgi:hypothetical protein
MDMVFPKEFIKIQFVFADKVAQILHISFRKALFEYTSIPIRVGIPFSGLQEENENWQTFIQNIQSKDDFEIAYKIHCERMKDALPMRMQFGCFSFDYLADEKLIKIHFANNDKTNPDVLSNTNQQKRQEELKLMFTQIKIKHPEAEGVVSSSWLYNIEKFKRLFPSEFFENTKVKWDFRSLGIWGQFIDKYGNIKTSEVDQFKIKVDKSITLNDLKEAFALKDIKCWSMIDVFYLKYNLI